MRFRQLLIRNLWFIVLLLIATFFLVKNVSVAVQKNREKVFSVSDVQKITRIVIEDREAKIHLQKDENLWSVNNDFIAEPDAVDALLRVLHRLQATSPISKSKNDSLKSIIQIEGIQVEVFAKRKLIKSFFLHAESGNDYSTVGLLPRAKSAYRLELPNYDGRIIDLFKTNTAYWRSRSLTLPSIESLIAVEVEIPQDPEQSFRIDVFDDQKPRLFHLQHGVSAKSYDEEKLNKYLLDLTSVQYNDVASNLNPDERHQINQMEPDFIFTFHTKDDARYQLKFFPIPIEETIDELGRTVNFDRNKLYATQANDENIYIVNYIEIHGILKNILYFNPNF